MPPNELLSVGRGAMWYETLLARRLRGQIIRQLVAVETAFADVEAKAFAELAKVTAGNAMAPIDAPTEA